MKKILFAVGAVVLAAVILGAGLMLGTRREIDDIADYGEDIKKTQKITVKDAESLEEIADITGAEEIQDFVEHLDISEWKLKNIPESAKPDREYNFSQQKTVKLGETEKDDNLYPVCSIITYKDMLYMTLSAGGVTMDFEVPQSVCDYLETAGEQ